MPALVFIAGPNAGRRYKLADGEYLSGRRSDCQLVVPDMRVSRQHARIRPDGLRWALEDLGSNNGTFVNGRRVRGSARVRPGDVLMVGTTTLTLLASSQDGPSLRRRPSRWVGLRSG